VDVNFQPKRMAIKATRFFLMQAFERQNGVSKNHFLTGVIF
jgi:hypothetical protein